MLGLWGASFIVTQIPEEVGSPDLSVWTAVLLIQSIPYAAALFLSLASAFPLPARLLELRVAPPTCRHRSANPVSEESSDHELFGVQPKGVLI